MANFTKQAIQASFLRLLDQKPLSQITIRDIVEDCGVNRNTFYYHFQDMPHLVETIINEEADRVIRAFPRIESIQACLDAMIDFAMQNKKAVLHIYHSVNRELYEQYQWRVCEHAVTAYLDGLLEGHSVSAEDRELLIDYVTGACFGLLMQWLERDLEDRILDRFHRLCQLKQGAVEALIQRLEA